MIMKNTLVVVTDLGCLKAFRLENHHPDKPPRLEPIEEFNNAEAHGKLGEKVTDLSGRFPRTSSAAHSAGAMSDGERHNIELESRKRLVRQLAQQFNALARGDTCAAAAEAAGLAEHIILAKSEAGSGGRHKVAILSGLPLETGPGGMQAMMSGHSRPYALYQELAQAYTTQMLPPDFASIPAGTDVLMIVHPGALNDAQTYAIDQFVLKGGRALVFVDPNSELAQGGAMEPGQQASFSTLPRLFQAWGIAFDTTSRRAVNGGNKDHARRNLDARFAWACDDPREIESWNIGLRLVESRTLADVPDVLRSRLPGGRAPPSASWSNWLRYSREPANSICLLSKPNRQRVSPGS